MITDHVHISHVTKLGGSIPCVNLPAVETCREDAPCFKKCYGRKGRFAFSHNKSLLQRNLAIWKEEPNQYERDVTIAAFHSRFFRWHSSGDIPDLSYLRMMVRVARALPNTRFLCFTKRYEWVDQVMWECDFPKNLQIVLSAWGDWQPDNPRNLPVAYIRFKKGETNNIPETAHSCRKFCGI